MGLAAREDAYLCAVGHTDRSRLTTRRSLRLARAERLASSTRQPHSKRMEPAGPHNASRSPGRHTTSGPPTTRLPLAFLKFECTLTVGHVHCSPMAAAALRLRLRGNQGQNTSAKRGGSGGTALAHCQIGAISLRRSIHVHFYIDIDEF